VLLSLPCYPDIFPDPSGDPLKTNPTADWNAMSSEELEYLKSLVAQLNAKIQTLEGVASNKQKQGTDANATAQEVPAKKFDAARQLRMILVGPPGAGKLLLAVCENLRGTVYLEC
jgi:DNA replication protein DnaC